MPNNRIKPKEKKPQSFVGNLFFYLPSASTLLKGVVMLLAVQSSLPSVVAAPSGRFLPKKDGLKSRFTDQDCVNADPDCKLEVQYAGVGNNVHHFDALVHCDIPAEHCTIPTPSLANQIRTGKFLGQHLCEGVLTDVAPNMADGIVDITRVDLKADTTSSNPTSFSVSQNSIFTKKPKAPECPPQKACSLFVSPNRDCEADYYSPANNEYHDYRNPQIHCKCK